MSESGCNGPAMVRVNRGISVLNAPGCILNRLSCMRDEGLLCDAVIRVCDGEFNVHRAVISTCTSYFDDKYLTETDQQADNAALQVAENAQRGHECEEREQIRGETPDTGSRHRDHEATTVQLDVDNAATTDNNNNNNNSTARSLMDTIDSTRHGSRDDPRDGSLNPEQPPRKKLKVCNLPDEKADIMGIIVAFAYCEEFVVGSDNVDRLLAAARRYNIRRIVDVCCSSFKIEDLSVDNCFAVQRLARELYDNNLEKAARRYVLAHFDDIAERNIERILTLSLDELVNILPDENLVVTNDELTAFNCIIRWTNGRHPREFRQEDINRLLRCVRLDRLSEDQLQHVLTHELFDNTDAAKAWIARPTHDDDPEAGPKFIDDPKSEEVPEHHPPLLEQLFVFGGWDSQGVQSSIVQTYDLHTEDWREVSSNAAPGPRAFHGCVSVDKLVYVIGGVSDGCPYNTLHCYDTDSGEWSEKAPMHSSRFFVAAAELDGCVFAVGGSDGGSNTCQKSAERYDPTSNEWNCIAPMNEARNNAAAASLNGKLFVVGGFSAKRRALSSVECHDPSTNQWTSSSRDLLTPRCGLGLVAVGDCLFAVGGRGLTSSTLKSVEKFDPTVNSWSTVADMHHERMDFAVGVIDGRVVVAGGTNKLVNIGCVDSVDCYDPQTNTWELCASDLVFSRCASGGCVVRSLPNDGDEQCDWVDEPDEQQEHDKQPNNNNNRVYRCYFQCSVKGDMTISCSAVNQ